MKRCSLFRCRLQNRHGAFEISAEVAPGVEFNPKNEFDITGGLGLRYYAF